MEPKVLVAIPTYEKERYALVPLLQGLQKQHFQNFDILFVDNSDDKKYQEILYQALDKAFPKKNYKVLHITTEKGRFKRILASRVVIREHFLNHKDYTHLFMLDSDIILPKSALGRLLASGNDICTGIYLNSVQTGEKELKILPCIFVDKKEGARRVDMIEVLKNERIDIGAAGLGCTLASRKVMEQASFGLTKKGAGEDITFYRSAVEAGVYPEAITSVKCLHLHFPLGDNRNRLFDPTRYKLKKE